MISLQDLLEMLANAFFEGNTQIAGIVLYMFAVGLVVLLFAQRNLTVAFVLLIPVTLIFTMMGILPEVMTILVVMVLVMGIASKFRDTTG